MGPSTLATYDWVGSLTPLHATSSGKVLLAALPAEERAEILKRSAFRPAPRAPSRTATPWKPSSSTSPATATPWSTRNSNRADRHRRARLQPPGHRHRRRQHLRPGLPLRPGKHPRPHRRPPRSRPGHQRQNGLHTPITPPGLPTRMRRTVVGRGCPATTAGASGQNTPQLREHRIRTRQGAGAPEGGAGHAPGRRGSSPRPAGPRRS